MTFTWETFWCWHLYFQVWKFSSFSTTGEFYVGEGLSLLKKKRLKLKNWKRLTFMKLSEREQESHARRFIDASECNVFLKICQVFYVLHISAILCSQHWFWSYFPISFPVDFLYHKLFREGWGGRGSSLRLWDFGQEPTKEMTGFR